MHVALLHVCRLQLRVTLRCLHLSCLSLGVHTLDEAALHSSTTGSRTLPRFQRKFNVRDRHTHTHTGVFYTSKQANFTFDFVCDVFRPDQEEDQQIQLLRKRSKKNKSSCTKKQIFLHKTVCKNKRWLSGQLGWGQKVLKSLDHKNKHLTSWWKQSWQQLQHEPETVTPWAAKSINFHFWHILMEMSDLG